jgi:AraC-like DNA-binding protein
MEARLRRLALNIQSESTRRRNSSSLDTKKLSKAEEMASYVALHYTEHLTAEMIGKHVGLHPNYAMTLFQQTFGTTLTNYITQHRLSHAQRLLVTTDQLILDIAFASGFGSLSRFNEAFRQSFACTPREYRRANNIVDIGDT